ncbi:hypothetical protein M2G84_06770 [Vibrio vulnificus]|nr:hypothetical protein [Vibrio vulnificus]
MNNCQVEHKASSTEIGIKWLDQFDVIDQPLAASLLDSIVWVSEREFKVKLEDKIKKIANSTQGTIGLFLEREIRKNRYGVQRFYKQSSKAPHRAYGAALQPIESIKRYSDEVGSEGVVGSIATGIMRSNDAKYFLHPTAEQIRSKKIRKFILLADTIGSGDQVSKCLNSLWKVASIKSWKSLKYIDFHVVCYTATEQSIDHLKKNKTKPKVDYVIPCPTIFNQFEQDEIRARIVNLCEVYGKKANSSNKLPMLGYSSTGALIAYSHGMPNNCPVVFFKRTKKWEPLFPSRVTSELSRELEPGERKIPYRTLLDRWKKRELSEASWIESNNHDAKNLVTIMASLYRPPRTNVAISARTNLDIDYVDRLLSTAKFYGWISKSNRLTDDGIAIIKRLERERSKEPIVFEEYDPLYFPSTLRASD